jgi:hypothetical protein
MYTLDMVVCSEAQLRSRYESDIAFSDARSEREDNRDAHYILSRPQNAVPNPEVVLPVGEYYIPEVQDNAATCVVHVL